MIFANRYRNNRLNPSNALQMAADGQSTLPEACGPERQRHSRRKPELLLPDEPLSAPDTAVRSAKRDFLRDVRRKYRIPVIMVTHDIFEAYSLADVVILYDEGRVTDAGTPREVFSMEAMPECEFPLFFSYMMQKGFF